MLQGRSLNRTPVACVKRLAGGINATLMLKIKLPTNGSKKRYRYSTRDPYRSQNGKSNWIDLQEKSEGEEAYAGTTELPNKLRGRYKPERIVGYLILCLLAGAGVELAIRTASNFFVMLIQICGFVASTIAIIIVKHKIGDGVYIGRQLSYAKGFYFWGVVFESLTLLTKYVPEMIQIYLISVAFTGPALLLSMGKLEDMDDDIRLWRKRREAANEKLMHREERILLNDLIPEKKELATLRAEDNIQDRRNSKMIRKSNGWFAWLKINQLASREMRVVYQNIQTKQQRKDTDKLKSATDARVLGERTHKRKRKGPTAESAPNGIYCKNPDCSNKLKGKQRSGCSPKCRTKISRLVSSGQLEKTW